MRLDDALSRYDPPEIFNTDQGSQFTSWVWTQRLKEAGVRISMDGRGRFLDNIFIERLWRSLKYECIYLHAFSGGRDSPPGDWRPDDLLQPSAPSCRAWRAEFAGRLYIEKGCRPPARAYAQTHPPDSQSSVTREL